MSEVDELSKLLADLGTRTQGLKASSGFADRVLLSVGEGAHVSALELLRSARRLLPVAIVAAVISMVWALRSEQSSNRALAASDPMSQELDW